MFNGNNAFNNFHMQVCREFFNSSHYSQLTKEFTQYIKHCRDYIDEYGKNIILKAIELEAHSDEIKKLLDHNINVYHRDKNQNNIWDYFRKQSAINENDQMCSQKIIYKYLQEKAFSCYNNHIKSPHLSLYCLKTSSLQLDFGKEKEIKESGLCEEIEISPGYSEEYLDHSGLY